MVSITMIQLSAYLGHPTLNCDFLKKCTLFGLPYSLYSLYVFEIKIPITYFPLQYFPVVNAEYKCVENYNTWLEMLIFIVLNHRRLERKGNSF